MSSLSPAQQKILKIVHLLAAACWIGGAWALMSLYWLKNSALVENGAQLFGVNQAAHHIDIWVVVIPGAMGCLLTGLVYCIFTRWGFFRHFWVAAKLVLTIAAILFGTFFLGPWEEAMVEISGNIGLAAFADPAYLSSQSGNFIGGWTQLAVFLIIMYLSVLKPKLRKKR